MMMSALEVVGQYAEGTDRNQAAMAVFGGRVGDLNAMLRLNEEKLAATAKLQKEMGTTITPEAVKSAIEYKDTMAEVGSVFDGVQKIIGDRVIGRLTEMGKKFVELAGFIADGMNAAMDVYDEVMRTLAEVGEVVWDAIKEAFGGIASIAKEVFGDGGEAITPLEFVLNVFRVVQVAVIGFRVGFEEAFNAVLTVVRVAGAEFGTFAAVMDRLLHLDFAGAKAAAKAGMEGMNNEQQKGIDAAIAIAEKGREDIDNALIGKKGVKDQEKSEEDKNKPHKKFTGKPEKSKDESQMPVLEQQLIADKINMIEKTGHMMSKEEESAWWKAKQAMMVEGSADYVAINKKMLSERLADDEKNYKDSRELEQLAIAEQRKMAVEGIAAREAEVKQRLAMGQIEKPEELRLMKELEDEKYALAVQSQMDLYALHAGDDVAQQKDLMAIQDLWRKHTATIGQLNNQLALDQKAQTDKLFAPMKTAFDGVLNGMLNGTLTLQKALQNIWQSIAASYAKMALDMGIEWVKKEIIETSATRIQTAIRTALGLEASAVSKTTKATEVAVTVPAEAAKGAAGAASSQAAIPIIGPALAEEAFASVTGLIMGAESIASSAGGEWNVPEDRLNLVHKNETILPANIATPLRNMVEGGGGSGSAPVIHLHAMDTVSIKSFLDRNGSSLVDSLSRQARQFNYGRTP
jgi:hypothetical protein